MIKKAEGKDLEKLIKGWKTCPLCGREANFEYEDGGWESATCKSCGARWRKTSLGKVGLSKPCTDGRGRIYEDVYRPPDWWMKPSAERAGELLGAKGRNIRYAGYAVLGLLALTVAFAFVTFHTLTAPKVPDIETAKIMALCLVGCGIAMSIVIAYALIEAGGLFEFIFGGK